MRFATLMFLAVAAFAQPEIPKIWDSQKLATFELPPPFPAVEYKAVSPEVYYRIPAFTIYKVYPVYAPGSELRGYWEHLHQAPAAWIAAGEAMCS